MKHLLRLSALFFAFAVVSGCGQPTDFDAGAKTPPQVYPLDSDQTQALLLTQKAPFDVANKNKVDGPYQPNQIITVPSDLTPQNKWIMFEGPVLENDKVAYRYYADSRHRFDIYGKKVSDLVMDTVSWQYHDLMDWGSDILKVGNSLGLGSPAIYYMDSVYTLSNCDTKTIEVMQTGGSRSQIRTTFKGLLIGGKALDIVQDWSIEAGDYYSTIDLSMSYGELPEGMHFATGIVSHLPEITSGSANGFDYLMNWGTQSYHEEGLGMAVMAKSEYSPKAVEDELSHLLVFKNAPEKVSYRFMAVWEQDQSGTKNATSFKSMVEAAAERK
ncbi:MAG: hypothetical protein ACI81P_002876 [Neolewinella sp.]|jgi:hypothetical protein